MEILNSQSEHKEQNKQSIKFDGLVEQDMNKTLEELKDLGISVDEKTGHLAYMPSYRPLNLEYQLVFIRHGETFGNCGQVNQDATINTEYVQSNTKDHEKRIFQGCVDQEINQLTKLGKEQAEGLANKLEIELIKKNWIPDAVLASPLKRAQETAVPFLKKFDLENKYEIENNIREMSFGEWDNRRVCDLDKENICHSFYKNQNALVKKTGINGNGIYQISENFCEVLLRAKDILLKLNDKFKGKKIIMFSHSMFGAACCILAGKGQNYENDSYLAFDGKKSDGTYYTMPHATPFLMNFKLN